MTAIGILKDTIMIKDRPYDRAMQVTVIAPDDVSVTNVQELAEKAWRSVNKTHRHRRRYGEGVGIQPLSEEFPDREPCYNLIPGWRIAMTEASLTALNESQVSAALSVLVPAFLGDPIFNHYFSDANTRRKVFELFFNDVVRGQIPAKSAFAMMNGEAISAVAVWMPPNPPEPTASDKERGERTVEQLRALDTRGTEAIVAGFEGLQAYHPSEPHWYLMFVGVDPRLQRRGLGRQLLTHVHEQADRTGIPCYLETPFPETRAFYGGLGYQEQREMRAFGDAPPLWTMLREPLSS